MLLHSIKSCQNVKRFLFKLRLGFSGNYATILNFNISLWVSLILQISCKTKYPIHNINNSICCDLILKVFLTWVGYAQDGFIYFQTNILRSF